MSTSSFSLFFALLTVTAWAGTAILGAGAIAHRRVPGSFLGVLFADVGQIALWLAALVAIATTCGSLYYSEIAHFVPCKLCWFQRIAMYPLSITLVVAAVRRDTRVWWYVVPPAVVGAAIAVYHAQLQAFPAAALVVLHRHRALHGSLRVGVRVHLIAADGTVGVRARHHAGAHGAVLCGGCGHGPEVIAIVACVQYAPVIALAGTIKWMISGATS